MVVEIKDKDIEDVLKKVGEVADELGVECYVVGGFVRDLILKKDNDDIDFVVVGSGLELAKCLAEKHNTEVCLYESYGTAKVKIDNYDLEFVGARKEFYHRESRNPIVEDGTLEDDLKRRDFTINAMAICVNINRFGEFIDLFGGVEDLNHNTIRCVGNPDERFSEDPLRMLRCIRFASRYGFFSIEEETYKAIEKNRERLKIIVKERIVEELNKMMESKSPSYAFHLLRESRLDEMIFPREFLKTYLICYTNINILKNVSRLTNDVWVRWAALFYNIKNINSIFYLMGFPLDKRLEKVENLVSLWHRVTLFCKTGFYEKDVRWLLYDAKENIYDVLVFSKGIIDTFWPDDEDINNTYEELRKNINNIEEEEHIIDFKLAVDGKDIMELFNLGPCKKIGEVKLVLIFAVLNGEIPNDRETLLSYVKERFKN